LRSDDGLQLAVQHNASVIELSPDKDKPAHPAARVITEMSMASLDRQLNQLNSLDAKASYLGAATFALLAGFLVALTTKPPATTRLEDLAVAVVAFTAGALVSIGYTWWPRPVDAPPNPLGLRERHWDDPEEAVLRAVSDRIATTFEDGRTVERKKAFGIKLGILFLGFATVLGTLDVLLIIASGGAR